MLQESFCGGEDPFPIAQRVGAAGVCGVRAVGHRSGAGWVGGIPVACPRRDLEVVDLTQVTHGTQARWRISRLVSTSPVSNGCSGGSYRLRSPRPRTVSRIGPAVAPDPGGVLEEDANEGHGGSGSVAWCLLRTSLMDGVLRLRGELDIATVPAFEAALAHAEATPGPAPLAVDLRALEFMDCAGLGVLVAAAERASAAGRQLTVMTGTGAAARLLRLCGQADTPGSAPSTQPGPTLAPMTTRGGRR